MRLEGEAFEKARSKFFRLAGIAEIPDAAALWEQVKDSLKDVESLEEALTNMASKYAHPITPDETKTAADIQKIITLRMSPQAIEREIEGETERFSQEERDHVRDQVATWLDEAKKLGILPEIMEDWFGDQKLLDTKITQERLSVAAERDQLREKEHDLDKQIAQLGAEEHEAIAAARKTKEDYQKKIADLSRREMELNEWQATLSAQHFSSKFKPPEVIRREQSRIEREVERIMEKGPTGLTPEIEALLKMEFRDKMRREDFNPDEYKREYDYWLDLARDELKKVGRARVEQRAFSMLDKFINEITKKPAVRVVKAEVLAEKEVIVGRLPTKQLSTLPFPRRPAREEKDALWNAFQMRLAEQGISPQMYLRPFKELILENSFSNWDEVKQQFETLVNDIFEGKTRFKRLRPPPMPWKNNRDAVVHFIATKQHKTVDELLDALERFGAVGITQEDAVKYAKEAWRDKDIWFTSVSREYLEKLLGQPVES